MVPSSEQTTVVWMKYAWLRLDEYTFMLKCNNDIPVYVANTIHSEVPTFPIVVKFFRDCVGSEMDVPSYSL